MALQLLALDEHSKTESRHPLRTLLSLPFPLPLYVINSHPETAALTVEVELQDIFEPSSSCR